MWLKVRQVHICLNRILPVMAESNVVSNFYWNILCSAEVEDENLEWLSGCLKILCDNYVILSLIPGEQT